MHELLEKIASRTDEAEVFGLDSTVNLLMFENNKLKNLSTLSSQGAAIRAKVNGRLGQSFTSDLRDPEKLAVRIRTLAELGDPVDFEFAGPASYPEIGLMHPSLINLTTEEMVANGQAALDELTRRFEHVKVGLTTERTLDRVQVLTSRGASAAFERYFYTCGIIAELVEGHNILRIAKFQKGMRLPAPAVEVARELGDLLETARKNTTFKPGKYRVIFTPASFADVLAAFTGSVDGDLVAKGVSPMAKRMGEQILDPRVTILDDPLHPVGIMSAPMDDEGTPTMRRTVVDRGVLSSFLASRGAAAQLGIKPTGNGWRLTPYERYKSFAVGAGTDFSNLVVAPGETPREQIYADSSLAIEVLQINGILLGDLIGGDFSGSLEVAFLVKDGQRIGRIKDAMISGNFFKLLKDQLAAISREQEWSGTFGGCSGSFLLPWICIDGVEISGTHE